MDERAEQNGHVLAFPIVLTRLPKTSLPCIVSLRSSFSQRAYEMLLDVFVHDASILRHHLSSCSERHAFVDACFYNGNTTKP